MKKQVKEWLKRAEIDLLSAEKLLDEKALTPSVAFHSHQTIEKSFKAILEEKGIRIPRTHDLELLYTKIQETGVNLQDINEDVLIQINEVYIDSRYPSDVGLVPYGIPSVNLAKEFFQLAQEIYTQIYNILKEKE